MSESTPLPISYLVRHGAMRFLGEFTPQSSVAAARGDTVVLTSVPRSVDAAIAP